MTEPRPLRDRLGEVLRAEGCVQFGVSGQWSDLQEGQRESWRKHADDFVRRAAEAGIDITERKRG